MVNWKIVLKGSTETWRNGNRRDTLRVEWEHSPFSIGVPEGEIRGESMFEDIVTDNFNNW